LIQLAPSTNATVSASGYGNRQGDRDHAATAPTMRRSRRGQADRSRRIPEAAAAAFVIEPPGTGCSTIPTEAAIRSARSWLTSDRNGAGHCDRCPLVIDRHLAQRTDDCRAPSIPAIPQLVARFKGG
jgi:hypothetical protein